MLFTRPKFIITLGECFFPINKFVDRLPNFFIKFGEPVYEMRFFFSKSMHLNIKTTGKNPAGSHCKGHLIPDING
jgi:hypothetical protein